MLRKALAGLALLSIAAGGQARAAGGYWAPIAGYGEVTSYPDNVTTSFTTTDGRLSISYWYDPETDPAPTGYIELNTGAGYDVVADKQIRETPMGNEVWFTAIYQNGGMITAILRGNPNDSSSWTDEGVTVTPSYHGLQIQFWGSQVIVPEPPTTLLLSLGLAVVAFRGGIRRMTKRPAAPGHAGC